MVTSNRSNNTQERPASSATQRRALLPEDEAADSKLIAYVILVPNDSDLLLETLLKNISPSSIRTFTGFSSAHASTPSPEPDDPWVVHSEAAKYLGVAKSTLYRYSCQERIETRKLGGRLEYRRSSLDRFKNQNVRAARRPYSRGTIVPTLGSGN